MLQNPGYKIFKRRWLTRILEGLRGLPHEKRHLGFYGVAAGDHITCKTRSFSPPVKYEGGTKQWLVFCLDFSE